MYLRCNLAGQYELLKNPRVELRGLEHFTLKHQHVELSAHSTVHATEGTEHVHACCMPF